MNRLVNLNSRISSDRPGAKPTDRITRPTRAEMEAVQRSNRVFTRLFRNLVTVTGGFAGAAPVDGEPTQDHLFDVLISGSPATCIDKLKSFETLGVDHFIMFVIGGSQAAALNSLRLFGERVIPAFRKD